MWEFLTVIAGGAIAIASMFFQRRSDMRKLALETKQYPFHVLCDKQTEFFDAAAPILQEIFLFVAEIHGWLSQPSVNVSSMTQKPTKKFFSVLQFNKLLGNYYIYLPMAMGKEVTTLLNQCTLLLESPDTGKTVECFTRVFALANTIRQFIGVDELPKELFQALVPRVQKDKSAQQEGDNPKS